MPDAQATPDESQTTANRLRSEIDAWKQASKNNQISGYEKYLKEYPHGRYAAIAKQRQESLQAETALKKTPKASVP